MRKTLNKLDTEGTYLNIMRAYMISSQLTSYSIAKALKAFPLRSGTRQGCSLLLLNFNIELEVLARAVKQEKAIKSSELERKK